MWSLQRIVLSAGWVCATLATGNARADTAVETLCNAASTKLASSTVAAFKPSSPETSTLSGEGSDDKAREASLSSVRPRLGANKRRKQKKRQQLARHQLTVALLILAAALTIANTTMTIRNVRYARNQEASSGLVESDKNRQSTNVRGFLEKSRHFLTSPFLLLMVGILLKSIIFLWAVSTWRTGPPAPSPHSSL